jgi:hypothetical protein
MPLPWSLRNSQWVTLPESRTCFTVNSTLSREWLCLEFVQISIYAIWFPQFDRDDQHSPNGCFFLYGPLCVAGHFHLLFIKQRTLLGWNIGLKWCTVLYGVYMERIYFQLEFSALIEVDFYTKGQIKSNQNVFVTCTEYNKCRLYREMLTYEPLTNNAVQ